MEEDYFLNSQDGGRKKRSRSRSSSEKRVSPYNRFVKNFSKTYKGKNLMKDAGAAWAKSGKGGAAKKTSRKTSRKGSRKTSRKQRGGAGLLSNHGGDMSGRTDDTAALKQILMQRLYGS